MSDERGYRTVDVTSLPDGYTPAREKKEVDEALGVTAFGFNCYLADEGDQLPWGCHRHPNHEELFYVLEGELAVETPEGTHRVAAGEAFFVPPGRRNRARATVDGTRVIAVGAPKDQDEAVIEEACPTCGERTRQETVQVDGASEDDGAEAGRGNRPTYVVRCAECGSETRRLS